MSKVERKEIAYYGRPIETLSKEELLQAIEELAGVIQDCAFGVNKCQEIISIKRRTEPEE